MSREFTPWRMARALFFYIPAQLARCLLVLIVFLGWGRRNAADAWRRNA